MGSVADSLYLRLFNTLQVARATYPRDPELLFQRGELLWAVGGAYGSPPESTREALASAVALDSGFVPAYLHLIHLDLSFGGRDTGLATVDAYLRRARNAPYDAALQLVVDLLREDDPEAMDRAEHRLDSLLALRDLITRKDEVLWWAVDVLGWASSRKKLLVLERMSELIDEGWFRAFYFPMHQYSLGLVRAAYQPFAESPGRGGPRQLYIPLARLGVVPRDTALTFLRWTTTQGMRGRLIRQFAHLAMPWWVEQRDSLSLHRVADECETLLASDSVVAARPALAHRITVLAANARAHLALLRGDSATALSELQPYRWCAETTGCQPSTLTYAALLDDAGRSARADALLGFAAAHGANEFLTMVEAALARGRLNERTGDRERAIWSYRIVMDMWADGDPEVQPYVEEARAGLERLGVEPES
jgi:hypothetical protein